MTKGQILWADDEIDLLEPHIRYLSTMGYNVTAVASGKEAIDKTSEAQFDIVFLDENMPGLNGLETLDQIKQVNPHLPIVMITKSEEESIMEDAIGKKISDFLIKPVRPAQIQLTLKKLLENKRLVQETTARDYRKEFQSIFMALQDDMSLDGWKKLYNKLIHWELELESSGNSEMKTILDSQKKEANQQFYKFVKSDYKEWISEGKELMSHNVLQREIIPEVSTEKPTIVFMIDNLRMDQWRILEPMINELFNKKKELTYTAMLPTCTQYCRNAFFAGLTPKKIKEKYPTLWLDDDEEGGKNKFEDQLFGAFIKRNRLPFKTRYLKIKGPSDGHDFENKVHEFLQNDLSVIVFNFVDMISHARTEMEILKELASDDAAYRSITKSWFSHSPLYKAIQTLSEKPVNIVITTDHGTKQVFNPTKIFADRATTTNLRYKNGKNLNFTEKDVFEIAKPEEFELPKPNISSKYVFAKEDYYFVYPNNYNHFVNYFKETFQHGGVSLEEMLIPLVFYTNK